MTDTIRFSTTRPLFGQVAIVTGAARGIGAAIAIHLARSGAHVVVNYRQSSVQANEVASLCRAAGVQAIATQGDVTKEADVARLMLAATELGVPTILVNNAGTTQAKLLTDTTLAEWNRLIESNLTSSFLCSKAVLPYMRQVNSGRIVNISSIWGLSGGSYEVAYSAAKGGLIAFTKALAKEVGKTGITVNTVAPGAIETDMLQDLSAADRMQIAEETPVGRLGKPDDVAHCVSFLVSPEASFMTGQILSPNGGLVT